ncbi:MAG: deoxyguanosinetriphosphate triphosphohydrolase [Clostridiales bacterium]|jgi:dGTPase|nr:deoxyguanosinetriphosphate triphosphohydrolase [Clostridiales bacterium]
MNYVEQTLKFEDEFLSEFATKSAKSKGRKTPLAADGLRTEFQRDRDRIIHCKAFRRLKHKTQVFLSPEGDHYRTRLTHTLEVSQLSRTVARALRLNEDLTEAIALGHDLGHTPYGHGGEKALQEFTHFEHNEQSLRMVDVLEYDGKGMNLTFEVRDGILNHTSRGKPATAEGAVVSWCDRIAYINHDIDDAVRASVIKESDIPDKFISAFGASNGRRINSMIRDIIDNSVSKSVIRPSDAFAVLIGELREFMFENVYKSPVAKAEEQKAVDMIKFLYSYFIKRPDKIPKLFWDVSGTAEQRVCDYISTMSDNFAVKTFEDIYVPKSWNKV